MSTSSIIFVMNENDLRVQRTRNLLRNALIELVKNQSYESISVRDITKKAQVGYKTFYRHYEGKDDLLQALTDEMVDEIKQVLAPPSDMEAPDKNPLASLTYMESNADLILTLLNSSAADQVLEKAVEFALEEGRMTFESDVIPDELMAHHFASSMISLLRWWLESEGKVTKSEMAFYIGLLVIQPMKALSNLAEIKDI
ncbi:MAG: TetR/AcrR family transcriptional regulator [Chloroflexota bacterium]